MFDRFSRRARQALTQADEEARDLGSERIEPAHVLLALTRDPGRGGAVLRAAGVDHPAAREALTREGADALAAVGIALDQVRAAAESAFAPGALDRARLPRNGYLLLAQDAKEALEGALRAVLAQPRPPVAGSWTPGTC